MQARASKSSFIGYVIQLGLQFFCTYFDSRLAACICFKSLSYLTPLGVHLDSMFHNISHDFDLRFQDLKNVKQSDFRCLPVEATQDTSQKRGEPRSPKSFPGEDQRRRQRFPSISPPCTITAVLRCFRGAAKVH